MNLGELRSFESLLQARLQITAQRAKAQCEIGRFWIGDEQVDVVVEIVVAFSVVKEFEAPGFRHLADPGEHRFVESGHAIGTKIENLRVLHERFPGYHDPVIGDDRVEPEFRLVGLCLNRSRKEDERGTKRYGAIFH